MPKCEAHGLALVCYGAFTLTKLLKRLQLNLEAVYIFTDSISQILALDKSPSLFDPPLNRYYVQCNAILFQIGLEIIWSHYLSKVDRQLRNKLKEVTKVMNVT